LSDGVRKASVVRLLIETDIIKRLKVSLEGADLTGADLSVASLQRADLNGAKLSVANLLGADLSVASLQGADLNGANLSGADLSSAKGLTKEQLEEAYLCETTLPKGIDMDPNRDCGKPYGEWLSERTEALRKTLSDWSDTLGAEGRA
jgi:hypothetical protein